MRSQSYHHRQSPKKKKEERRREAEGTSAREMLGSEAPLVLVKSARAEVKILFQLPFSSEYGGFVVSESERKREREIKESGAMSTGARTRGQKRRRGERDVWDLIVKCDDICFKHILPRMNSTDVKFLYGVNTETRKLIKRSSRAGDLKKRFKVQEMSSISTLEVAWENKSLWPRDWIDEERDFCYEVAETNKLELLKWAREEKKCEWDYSTIDAAASQGNLEMVKYCVANECPVDEDACAHAAENLSLIHI